MDASFVGCELDENFIKRLPQGVDPCGENGEFHTFVYDGPLFKNRVSVYHWRKSAEKLSANVRFEWKYYRIIQFWILRYLTH